MLGCDAGGIRGADCNGSLHGSVGPSDRGNTDGGLLVIGADTSGAALLHTSRHRESNRDIEVPQRCCEGGVDA